MTVWAGEDFKTILRYAKLARLMHTIIRRGPGQYVFRFDGPASVLRETRRYGAAMARFLPALVACRGWRMHAMLRTRRRGCTVEPGPFLATTGCPATCRRRRSSTPAWKRRSPRSGAPSRATAGGWSARPRCLHSHQKVFVPDFVFRHDDGRTVLMEIVGFWTPEYLQAKVQTLRAFRDHRILLAVASRHKRPSANCPPRRSRTGPLCGSRTCLSGWKSGGAMASQIPENLTTAAGY